MSLKYEPSLEPQGAAVCGLVEVCLRRVDRKVPGGDNYFTEMCSGSEAGSCLRLIDFVYHSILGLGVIKKKKIPWHIRRR